MATELDLPNHPAAQKGVCLCIFFFCPGKYVSKRETAAGAKVTVVLTVAGELHEFSCQFKG